jgi:hypothetical protein
VISKRIPKPLEDYYKYSQKSRLTRFIFGIRTCLIVWGTGILLEFILSPFVSNNIFGETLLHDLPGFTLVFGLILLLEFWGLIPHLKNTDSAGITED